MVKAVQHGGGVVKDGCAVLVNRVGDQAELLGPCTVGHGEVVGKRGLGFAQDVHGEPWRVE